MSNFEEYWEKAMMELEAEEHKNVGTTIEFIASNGEGRKIQFVPSGEKTFVAFNSLRRACGASVLPTNAKKRGIVLEKAKPSGAGRSCWVLDAMNAVRFVARYDNKEIGFKQFFRDRVFPKLSEFDKIDGEAQ